MLRKKGAGPAGRAARCCCGQWQLVGYIVIHVYTYHSERAVSLCVADEFEPIEATEGAMHLLNRVRAAELELRRSDAER